MNGGTLALAMVGGLEILMVVAVAFVVALIVSVVLVLLVRVVSDGRETRRRLRALERQVEEVRARLDSDPPKP